MKPIPMSILVLVLSTLVSARADDVLPKRLEFNRYAAMIERSPFAVATAPTQVVGPPAWAKDLYIANAGHTPEMDSVTISSLSDKSMKEWVTTEGPNEHGYSIANIEWSDTPGSTKVTISKDGQFATVGFNEAILSQNPSSGQPPPSMPAPQPGIKQPNQPVQPNMPQPHVRGVIQRSKQPGVPTPIPNAAPLEPPD